MSLCGASCPRCNDCNSLSKLQLVINFQLNTIAVCYFCRCCCVDVVLVVVVLYSREMLKKKLEEALDVADVVVTSGGVSMGEMVSRQATHSNPTEITWPQLH